MARFQLSGDPGNLVEDEININVEGGFVATSLGYGLLVEERDAPINLGPKPPATIEVADQPLSAFPLSSLKDGIRIRPDFLRIAFDNFGGLSGSVPGSQYRFFGNKDGVNTSNRVRGEDGQKCPKKRKPALGLRARSALSPSGMVVAWKVGSIRMGIGIASIIR